MNAYGIKTDDKENGIWLPKRDTDKIKGVASTSHQQDGVHGKAYREEICNRLNRLKKENF